MAQFQNEPSYRSNSAMTWVLTSALVVTVLFVSFALFFSRSLADTGPTDIETQADVNNVAPVIEEANVFLVEPDPGDISSFPGKLPIVPTASTTAPAWVEILVRDDNGWEDVDPDSLAPGSIDYSGYLVDTDSAVSCTPGYANGQDDYTCYTPISFANCSLVATSTLKVLVSCPFDINYYTKPGGAWDLVVDVVDRGGLTDNINSAETVDELLAYNLDLSTLDFGAVTVPIITAANSNKEVRFANAGNVAVADLQVDHTPMTCWVGGVTPGGTIDVDGLAYSTSSIPDLSYFAVSGTITGTEFAFAIPHATTNTSAGYQSKKLYNHLRQVDSGTVGSCTGTITFTPSS